MDSNLTENIYYNWYYANEQPESQFQIPIGNSFLETGERLFPDNDPDYAEELWGRFFDKLFPNNTSMINKIEEFLDYHFEWYLTKGGKARNWIRELEARLSVANINNWRPVELDIINDWLKVKKNELPINENAITTPPNKEKKQELASIQMNPEKRGTPTELIRIIHALYKLKYFSEPSEDIVMNKFGSFMKLDLSNHESILSQSRGKYSKAALETFEKLKTVMDREIREKDEK